MKSTMKNLMKKLIIFAVTAAAVYAMNLSVMTESGTINPSPLSLGTTAAFVVVSMAVIAVAGRLMVKKPVAVKE